MRKSVIYSYDDILNEMLGNPEEHANLVSCASVFCNVQDGICSKNINEDNSFDITFEFDGDNYRISGLLENGEVKIKGIYRKSQDFDNDVCCNYLSFDAMDNALGTRDGLGQKLKEKIVRILQRVE